MRSNRTFMELKWKKLIIRLQTIYRSNRTFMELKLDSRILNVDGMQVLIVPLWN